MKKFLLYFLVLSVANTLFAQYNGAGYYRVQNKVTERYIRVIDNKGSVNLSTTDADLGALETKKKFENVVSDPASIIYISPAGDGYNFKAQGTSSYSIIGYYVKLYKNNDGSYRAYAQHNGLTKYLCDENTTYNEGVVLTNSTKTRDWYIKPVNQTEGQYFAFKPSVTVGSEHYTTIYADFPFTLPAGMTAYYVTTVDGAQAVWKEVKDGKVPASTAVYVKCKSANYADNKVSVGDNGVTSLSGNLMKGVYFNNGTKKHNNQLAYNPNTMRVLGVMSDGKLGFVTANINFIPANTAYLVVPANSPSEIKLISESDYKPYVAVQSVSLSQSKLTMYAGDSHTLAATVLPSNATDKSLKWSSSNSSVATVDANGLVKAVGYGKATITVACASNSALKATCEVNVYARCTGVQISATTQQLYVGDSFMLTAHTLPLSTTDGKIEWSVSDENVVKRSADGTVTAVGAGTAEVIAKSVDGGHIAKCTVTVKVYVLPESVTLNKQSLTMYSGDTFTLVATVLPQDAVDKSLNWSSSDNNVITIDSNGTVKAVGYGKATVTVACAAKNTIKTTCEITVYEHTAGVKISATSKQLYEGESFMLTANTLPLSTSDGKIEWSISNEKVVKRNADGTVVAVGVGTADVVAKSVDGGHTAKCTVTVKKFILPESVTLNKQSLTMYSGDTFNLVATVLPDDVIDNSIEWSSSDNNVVTVNSDGFVKAVGYGKAIVTATCVAKNTVKAVCEVTVYEHCTGVELSATNAELLVGKSFTLTANTLPLAQSDGLIEWSVSDNTIISRNADGVVVALAEGMAEVIAKSVDGGHIAKCKVTVKTIPVAEKIILSESSLTMYAGDKYTVTAEVFPEDAENKALTWHSSSEAVAAVADGNITAVGYGKANVIAHITTNNAVADTCSVIVYEHATGVELSESDLQLYVGDSFALTANTLPLGKSDNLIEWSISDETVISRNADGDIVALAEGVAEVSVKALDGGHIAKCRVTVTVPVAEEVMLSDNSLVMYVGDNYTLTAEVLPHNAVNKALTWLSSNEVVVGIDEGEVTAKSYGNADIIVSVAQYTRNSVVSDTCSVMVYEHTAGVEISATDVEMNIGETIVLTANTLPIATTDGALEWSVSDESVLSRDDDGTIVALAEGVAEVTATSVDGGYTAKCTIVVRSSTGIEDLFHESNACRIYNLHGVQFDRLQRGVNVVIFEDGTSKKVIVE